MNWEELPDGSQAAAGRAHEYLAVLSTGPDGDVQAVVLTRYRHLRNLAAVSGAVRRTAEEAARCAIVLPFGRGPGRPAVRTDSEIEAMLALAQDLAGRYEAGESLDGYPEWTHGQPGEPVRAVHRYLAGGGSDD